MSERGISLFHLAFIDSLASSSRYSKQAFFSEDIRIVSENRFKRVDSVLPETPLCGSVDVNRAVVQ